MQLALPLSRENEKEHLTTGLGFFFSPKSYYRSWKNTCGNLKQPGV